LTRIIDLKEPANTTGEANELISVAQVHKPISVKQLATLYGLKAGAVYEFIRTDPSFPYVNAGVKKKFLINTDEFETWLKSRTTKQKHEHFAVPSSLDLISAFKNSGGNK
jgi:hypothetical protein